MLAGVARLAWGVEGLALLVLVEQETDSYATAGLAVGAFGITSGLLAPMRGTLIDRQGRRALLSMAVLNGILVVSLAVAPFTSGVGYIVVAAVAGTVPPPVTAWIRAGMANRIQGAELHRAYTVDNVLEEFAFVGGPLIAGLVIAVASPSAALILSAALALFGVVGLTLPGAMAWAPRRRVGGDGPRKPLNRPLLLAIVSLAGLGAGVGFAEIAIVGFAEREGSQAAAGLILAALSAGGVIGALAYGAREWAWTTRRRYVWLMLGMAAGLAALTLPDSIAVMVAVIAVAGLFLTPIFIVNSVLIAELSPEGPSATAFAGVTTAMNAGVAVGAAIGGGVVDRNGPDTAFLLAAVAVALGALVALALPVGRAGAMETGQ